MNQTLNRATLHCPQAFCTKAQPSYPNTPHRTAGNLWPAIHQDEFTTETETSSVVVRIKVMRRMLCSSFVYDSTLHLKQRFDSVGSFAEFFVIVFLFVWIYIISSNRLIKIIVIWYYYDACRIQHCERNAWNRTVHLYCWINPVTGTNTPF